VTNDVDTLATALYAATDDMLKEHPDLAPWRPPAGTTPRLSDAELVTLATMQAVPGCTSEARWLRHTRVRLRRLFPRLPQQPGCSKRLREAAGLIRSVNRILATVTSVRSDDVWVVDSTLVECGPLPLDRQTFRPGRSGRIRLLRQPQPLLPGPAPAPGLQPSGPAHRLRPDRGQVRRTQDPP
jgi:hypothetical protein